MAGHRRGSTMFVALLFAVALLVGCDRGPEPRTVADFADGEPAGYYRVAGCVTADAMEPDGSRCFTLATSETSGECLSVRLSAAEVPDMLPESLISEQVVFTGRYEAKTLQAAEVILDLQGTTSSPSEEPLQ